MKSLFLSTLITIWIAIMWGMLTAGEHIGYVMPTIANALNGVH